MTDVERDAIVARLVGALATSGVPHHLRDGLVRYVADGILPGSFLQAILVNDLRQTALRAAPGAWAAIPDIIVLLDTAVPAFAWGSREAVLMWTTTPDRLEV